MEGGGGKQGPALAHAPRTIDYISISGLSSQGGGRVGKGSDSVLLGLPKSPDLPFETATLPTEETSASEKETACSVSMILSWASGGLSP